MSTFAPVAAAGRTDTWLTPPNVLKAVGPFDLDPCAAGAEYGWRPWETAAESYTWGGLERPWHGFVWCNPPYSDPEPWMANLGDFGNGIGCVFARVETDWFFKTAWERGAGLFFLRGRIKFCTPDGRPTRSGVAPSVLVGYGDEALRRLANAPNKRLRGHLSVSAAAMLISAEGKPVGTWQDAVAAAMGGRTLRLRDIYAAAEGTSKVRVAKMRGHDWQAQVRRALQVYFRPVKTAVWSAA